MRTHAFLSRTAPAALLLLAAAPLPARDADTDGRIEKTIQASYTFRTYLKDDAISVKAEGGVVTLSGSVSEDYHRELALETASGVPGVESVKDELKVKGPQPEERSDPWITAKVKAALAFHAHVSAGSTHVDTTAGVVTLSGKAGTEAQKELSGEYARSVSGVKGLRNELVVTGHSAESLGEQVDDASITAQIKTELLFHSATHAASTQVETHNGAVTLRGVAENPAEKDLATKLAEDVHGVKRVDNRMAVKP